MYKLQKALTLLVEPPMLLVVHGAVDRPFSLSCVPRVSIFYVLSTLLAPFLGLDTLLSNQQHPTLVLTGDVLNVPVNTKLAQNSVIYTNIYIYILFSFYLI